MACSQTALPVDAKGANCTPAVSDQTAFARSTASPPPVAGQDQSDPLLPLTRLLARHAARQHVLRHRGYGMLQVAVGVVVLAVILMAALLLTSSMGVHR